MDDRLQYASMLGIPVNTCSVTLKQGKQKAKKRKKIDSEQVKQQLLDKVNNLSQQQTQQQEDLPTEIVVQSENQTATVNSLPEKPKKPKLKFKLNAVALQVVIIIALIATIFITNSAYPNSGINVFMRTVFGKNAVVNEDLREYTDFAPTVSGGAITLSNGVINVKGQVNVYACCDGKVVDLTLGEDGKYSMQIMHSKNFSSMISGIDLAYCEVGDMVYGTIPVGFVKQEMNLCFTDSDGAVIVNYTLVDDAVVWAV